MTPIPFLASATFALLVLSGCASNNTAYNQQVNAKLAGDKDNHPPRLLHSEDPIFPPGPRLRGKTDWHLEIDVEFIVDERGAVRSPRVIKSSDAFYNSLALECVEKWRFEPAHRDGQPVATRLRAPFRFRMTAGEAVR
jgi:TonB family protein